ncbi:hypothetical protein FMN50_09020 [Rhodobacterales bacterium]|nr:hypothetical protein FMN50_09020 [Rhodobacterales bacterium]
MVPADHAVAVGRLKPTCERTLNLRVGATQDPARAKLLPYLLQSLSDTRQFLLFQPIPGQSKSFAQHHAQTVAPAIPMAASDPESSVFCKRSKRERFEVYAQVSPAANRGDKDLQPDLAKDVCAARSARVTLKWRRRKSSELADIKKEP